MRIDVKGTVIPDNYAWIYDLFDEPYISPGKIHAALEEAAGDDIDLDINSAGGDVFAGSDIYAAIRDYPGNVNIHVVGLAASAASVIACAGHSDIAPTAQVMVHNVSCYSGGDYHDHDKTSEILKQANRAIAAAYTAKSAKLSEKDALDLMNTETWLTASDAVEWGLIDEISENKNANKPTDDADDIRMAAAAGHMIPASVIDKMLQKQQDLIDFFS